MTAGPARDRAALAAAARRLAGQLVSTPVIGDLCLPDHRPDPELRIKAEMLQPGGSLLFRGAEHWLGRRLGRLPGLVVDGPPASLLPWAMAARGHRLPTVVRLAAPPAAAAAASLAFAGCTVVGPGDTAAGRGFAPLPPADDPDFLLGIATVAGELAAELPSDTVRLVVAPRTAVAGVELGVRLLDLGWRVEAADAAAGSLADQLVQALADHHRLLCGRESGAALARALLAPQPGTCVVLGC